MCGNLRETDWQAILTRWAKGKKDVEEYMSDPSNIRRAKDAAEENRDYNNDDANWYER